MDVRHHFFYIFSPSCVVYYVSYVSMLRNPVHSLTFVTETSWFHHFPFLYLLSNYHIAVTYTYFVLRKMWPRYVLIWGNLTVSINSQSSIVILRTASLVILLAVHDMLRILWYIYTSNAYTILICLLLISNFLLRPIRILHAIV